MDSLRAWLQTLGLERYAQLFAESEVDLEALCLLGEQDFEKLGVPLGPTKKLLKAIAELNGAEASAATPQAVPDQTHTARAPGAEAERRQLTVMFCDLVGSTELATKLDPEHLRDLMQAYQRTCGEVIERYDGHVAQYLGDGLMVYFGWPQAHEDDAVRAIRAALEVVDAVSRLKAAAPIRARVGIHTGLVVVGETGQGDASIPKAAVGETPNIAARLQSLAEPSSVVVSERTRSLAAGLFDYADMGTHPLKGVSEPVRLSRVLGTRATESRFDASSTEVALTPLVGREEEIALLLRRWQQAKEGEGQVVLVGGEPGIGKSRLARVLRDRLGQERHKVLRYQCSPYHVNSALYPAIEGFERAAGFTREDSPEQQLNKMEAVLAGSAQEVAACAPLFASMLSLPIERYPALNLSPQKQKEKTLEALASQIEALAQRQPLLMLWEDTHWIDATSQEFMDLLVPRLRHLPVLVMVTYRPESTPRWTDQAHVTTLGLNRLGRRQGAELLAKLTGGKPLPQEVLDQVLAHTDGVPLFIEELTKSVLESKLLRDAGDRYVLDGPLPALAIPTTLRDSLIARLDRLAAVRELAQIGACIGREFSYDLLAAVCPLKGERLDDALEQLTKTGLVFRRGAPPDATYTFKHALVQDAAYDSLLKSRRAPLHAQIAQTLEEDFSDQGANEPELLANHFTQAGLLEKAIPYWRRAGTLAARRMAIPEASSHYGRALELLAKLPPSNERNYAELATQLELGSALISATGWAAPETRHAFTRALELCSSMGDTPDLLQALFGLGAYHTVRGEQSKALEVSRRLLAGADRAGDLEAQIAAHYLLGQVLVIMGETSEGYEHLKESLALYGHEYRPAVASRFGQDFKTTGLGWLSWYAWMLGYPERALGILAELDAYAEDVGHPYQRMWARFARGLLDTWARQPQGESGPIISAQAICREFGFGYFDLLCTSYQGRTLICLGRTEQGIQMMEEGVDALRAVGSQLGLSCLLAQLAEGHLDAGDADGGLEVLDEALRQANSSDEHHWDAELWRLRGELLLIRNSPDTTTVEIAFLKGFEIARRLHAKCFELRAATSLARLWQRQGQRREAHELLAPVYNWFTEGFDTHDLKQAKTLLDELS